MKFITNTLAFVAATCAILMVMGFVAKVYWFFFMLGWGVLS
ncbi:MAG: hypothetical protein RL758_26 [Pseudomonadota bacterium]|jgi:hypothetical protein